MVIENGDKNDNNLEKTVSHKPEVSETDVTRMKIDENAEFADTLSRKNGDGNGDKNASDRKGDGINENEEFEKINSGKTHKPEVSETDVTRMKIDENAEFTDTLSRKNGDGNGDKNGSDRKGDGINENEEFEKINSGKKRPSSEGNGKKIIDEERPFQDLVAEQKTDEVQQTAAASDANEGLQKEEKEEQNPGAGEIPDNVKSVEKEKVVEQGTNLEQNTIPEQKIDLEQNKLSEVEFKENLENFSKKETEAYERQKEFKENAEGFGENLSTHLEDYTDHGLAHVQEVMQECDKVADGLEQSDIEISDSTKHTCEVAAKYHDIGMGDEAGMEAARTIQECREHYDGNFSAVESYLELDASLTPEALKEEYNRRIQESGDNSDDVDACAKWYRQQEDLQNAARLSAEIRDMAEDDPQRAGKIESYEGYLGRLQDGVFSKMRTDHPKESGYNVLENKEAFAESYGSDVDPRSAACAIMLHSKTNSGCYDLCRLHNAEDSQEDPRETMSVEDSCKKFIGGWNEAHPDQPIDDSFTDEQLCAIATEASVLRAADNRRNGDTALFTSGDRVVCETNGDDVHVYHSDTDENGEIIKTDKLHSKKSEEIIAAESCTVFGAVRSEGGNLVHEIQYTGENSETLENLFLSVKVIDYAGEVESGVFRSESSASHPSPIGFHGENILEIEVNVESEEQRSAMEERWKNELQNMKKHTELARQYAERIRLVRRRSEAAEEGESV